MMTGLRGADIEALEQLSRQLGRQASVLRSLTSSAGGAIGASGRYWDGPDAATFRDDWVATLHPRLADAARSLDDAARVIDANRVEQQLTSAAEGSGSTNGVHRDVFDNVTDFLLGDIGNFWTGGRDGFPVGSSLAGVFKMLRIGRGELPLFNTGLVGRHLAAQLVRGPGLLNQAGLWMQSPAASTFFRRAGIVGGVVSTGYGAYQLYEQGNPIDAFQREGAGYVADVAGTAFSASTTAFLIAPNPVTAGLAIGTGVVWIGAEVVDNWDDITEFAADTWDAGSEFVGDAWDVGSEFVGDAWDVGGDLLGDIGGGLTSVVPDWF